MYGVLSILVRFHALNLDRKIAYRNKIFNIALALMTRSLRRRHIKNRRLGGITSPNRVRNAQYLRKKERGRFYISPTNIVFILDKGPVIFPLGSPLSLWGAKPVMCLISCASFLELRSKSHQWGGDRNS